MSRAQNVQPCEQGVVSRNVGMACPLRALEPAEWIRSVVDEEGVRLRWADVAYRRCAVDACFCVMKKWTRDANEGKLRDVRVCSCLSPINCGGRRGAGGAVEAASAGASADASPSICCDRMRARPRLSASVRRCGVCEMLSRNRATGDPKDKSSGKGLVEMSWRTTGWMDDE